MPHRFRILLIAALAVCSAPTRLTAHVRFEFTDDEMSARLGTITLKGSSPYEASDVILIELSAEGDELFGFDTQRIEPAMGLHRGSPDVVDDGDGGLESSTELDVIWRDAEFPIQLGFGASGNPDRFDKPQSFSSKGTWHSVFDIADFDQNGQLDVGDVDRMRAVILAGSNEPTFDLDGSATVDMADLTIMIRERLHTWIGDTNLDGEFNSGDLVRVFQEGRFETGQPATWASGDWNGDKVFDSGDFVVAFQDGGFEQGPRGAAVPEPATVVMLIAGLIGVVSVSRSRAELV